MSKFVDDIIHKLKNEPDYFYLESEARCMGFDIGSERISIEQLGNTRFLSVIKVRIRGDIHSTSYLDKWRLEVAGHKWLANRGLNDLAFSKTNNNPRAIEGIN